MTYTFVADDTLQLADWYSLTKNWRERWAADDEPVAA